MGSPRRRRALPPSATTIRMMQSLYRASGPDFCGSGLARSHRVELSDRSDIRQSRDQDRLNGVHAVFRLLEGDVGRRLEHLFGDLDAIGQVRITRGDILADLG